MGVNSFPWYHTPDPGGLHDLVLLTGEEWHHCRHVMRMQPGDSLILFDGEGHAFEGIIRKATRAQGEIELVSDLSTDFQVSSTCRINIAFAPTKSPDRSEMAIEKMVELGVESIAFLDCLNGERTRMRMDRTNKIMIGAAKQSRKTVLPHIQSFMTPQVIVQQWMSQHPTSIVLCCHLDTEVLPLYTNYHGEDDVLVLIGPEGGFDPKEITDLKSAGVLMTSLGPHRLRVETAVITACANIHLLHDMKHHL